MRKSKLLLCVLAFASIASTGFSHADACGSARRDPFGSCESGSDTNYSTHCATKAAVPSVGAVSPVTTTPPSPPPAPSPPPMPEPTNLALPQVPQPPAVDYTNGVEGCIDGAAIPVGGRAGVLVSVSTERDPNGTNYTIKATVFEDGNETKDPTLTSAFNRVDGQTTVKNTNPGDAGGATFVCARRGETGTWDSGAARTLDKGASGNGVNDGC
jgi:hypothetical protein